MEKVKCRQCSKEHYQADISRDFGSASFPYLLRYCSDFCYEESRRIYNKELAAKRKVYAQVQNR